MIHRIFNAVVKAVKVFPVGFLGSLLGLVLPFADKLVPEPLAQVTTWEAVGISILIGALTGLVSGLKRFAMYKAALDPTNPSR